MGSPSPQSSPVEGEEASPLRRLLSLLGGRALDLLLPLRCVGCDREGRFLCERCHDGLPRLSRPYCSVCSAPGGPDPCEWCASERPPIEGVRAPYLMDGAVRDAVHAIKYRGYRAGAPALARLMAGYLSSHAIAATALVPVPLHRRRERGARIQPVGAAGQRAREAHRPAGRRRAAAPHEVSVRPRSLWTDTSSGGATSKAPSSAGGR